MALRERLAPVDVLPDELTASFDDDCIAHTAKGLAERVREKVIGINVSLFKPSNLPPWFYQPTAMNPYFFVS